MLLSACAASPEPRPFPPPEPTTPTPTPTVTVTATPTPAPTATTIAPAPAPVPTTAAPSPTPAPAPTPTPTPTPTVTVTPTPTPTPTPKVILPSEQSITAYLYPSITIGDFVNQIGYALSNGSSQPITAIKLEFLDQNGNVKTSVSEETIQAASHKGVLQPGLTFNWSKSCQIPYPKAEVNQWIVKWYCRDMNASPFMIIGHSIATP